MKQIGTHERIEVISSDGSTVGHQRDTTSVGDFYKDNYRLHSYFDPVELLEMAAHMQRIIDDPNKFNVQFETKKMTSGKEVGKIRLTSCYSVVVHR